jgi:hypothetical protein
MASNFLSPHHITNDDVLTLETKSAIIAWVHGYSFFDGKAFAFVRKEIPAYSKLIFERFDLWIVNNNQRLKIRFYDFACKVFNTTDSPDGYEILLTLSGAIGSGLITTESHNKRNALMQLKQAKTPIIPDDMAHSMLERCELMPASSKSRGEYRIITAPTPF